METTKISAIKKKLIRGDRKRIARNAKCSIQTVDFTFNHRRSGPKSQIVLQTAIELLEDRKIKQEKLLQRIKKL